MHLSTPPHYQTIRFSLQIVRFRKSITKVKVSTLLPHKLPQIIIILAHKCSHLLAHFLWQARNLLQDKLPFLPILKILSYWKKKVVPKLVSFIKIHNSKMEIYTATKIIKFKKNKFRFKKSFSNHLVFKITVPSFRTKHFKTKII